MKRLKTHENNEDYCKPRVYLRATKYVDIGNIKGCQNIKPYYELSLHRGNCGTDTIHRTIYCFGYMIESLQTLRRLITKKHNELMQDPSVYYEDGCNQTIIKVIGGNIARFPEHIDKHNEKLSK